MSPFLNLPIAKGGTQTIAHLSIAEGLSFHAFSMVNCGQKKDLIQMRSEFSPLTSKLVAQFEIKNKEAL
jgi:hypothetical protein